jgi:hypothetical protein
MFLTSKEASPAQDRVRDAFFARHPTSDPTPFLLGHIVCPLRPSFSQLFSDDGASLADLISFYAHVLVYGP